MANPNLEYVITAAGTKVYTYTTVKTATDAVILTPDVSKDIISQVNTQIIGNLTVNAPIGDPTDGKSIGIRIKSTNVQTFVWDAIYRGCTTIALPVTSSGGGLTDYFEFMYNEIDGTWDLQLANYGF
jgi:hypothetical protein